MLIHFPILVSILDSWHECKLKIHVQLHLLSAMSTISPVKKENTSPDAFGFLGSGRFSLSERDQDDSKGRTDE